MTVTWREMISNKMESQNDSWENIDSCTLSEKELDQKFDSGYVGIEGEPFTVWTKEYIYFPVCYDGAEGVGTVSRNPDGKPTEHVGGG